MTTLLVIFFAILAATYVVVLAVTPEHSRHSLFELKRRGNEAALRRERSLGSIYDVKYLMLVFIASLLATMAVVVWQGWSIAIMLGLLLLAAPVARVSVISEYVSRLYMKFEPTLLAGLERQPTIIWLARMKRQPLRDTKLESTEQLLHLVAAAGHVLDGDQQAIIRNGVDWHTTKVSSVMTPRHEIHSVQHKDLLGPLVLDDLHRTGHSRFPVIKGGLDEIMGILDITELLEITSGKATSTAEAAMSPQALRIEADEPLPKALALLQKSHQHVLIVIDADGKTAGILTLADITGSLLGETGVK